MERIVFKNPDGTCGILIPAKGWEDRLEDLAQKDVPDGLDYRITDNIPSDRTFRNAWTDDNDTDTVDVDMDKAKVIHMDHIRRVRDEKLRELDVETLRGNDVQTQKQVLRDIPDNFNLSTATTPEELKALWPTELE